MSWRSYLARAGRLRFQQGQEAGHNPANQGLTADRNLVPLAACQLRSVVPYKDLEVRRAYNREYTRSWRKGRPPGQRKPQEARQRVAQLKSNPCTDCGGTFHPVCMDFDHRPGEVKIANVATLVGRNRPWSIVEAEIAKCDLVCANCHRLRTYKRHGFFGAGAI